MSVPVSVDSRESAVVYSESRSICVYVGMCSVPVTVDFPESVGV
jgi:hypothetical protein